MPSRCSVAGCPNRRNHGIPGTIFICHAFPKDSGVKKKWVEACRREEINPSHARICSIHFLETDYVRDLKSELLGEPPRKILKKGAVPTLNLPQRIGCPRIKMRNRCAVLTCPNRYADFGKTLYFFKFPENSKMKQKWVNACKIEKKFITNTSEMCSEHFLDSDYIREIKTKNLDNIPSRIKALRKHLKKDAVPSINLPELVEPHIKKFNFQENIVNHSVPIIIQKSVKDLIAKQESNSNSVNFSKTKKFNCNKNKRVALQNHSNSETDIYPSHDSSSMSLDELQNCTISLKQSRVVIDKHLPKSRNLNAEVDSSVNMQDCSNCAINISTSYDTANLSSNNLNRHTTSLKRKILTSPSVALNKVVPKDKKYSKSVNVKFDPQTCSNCSDMLLRSMAYEIQLSDMKDKVAELERMSEQTHKRMTLLEEENKLLKAKLDVQNTSKLQDEMEKILNGVLSKSQVQCLMNQAQKDNAKKEDIASALKLKPIGTYRLYSVPRETL